MQLYFQILVDKFTLLDPDLHPFLNATTTYFQLKNNDTMEMTEYYTLNLDLFLVEVTFIEQDITKTITYHYI